MEIKYKQLVIKNVERQFTPFDSNEFIYKNEGINTANDRIKSMTEYIVLLHDAIDILQEELTRIKAK